MENETENENVVPYDRRAITIHSHSMGLMESHMFPMHDTKISIYYLPKNSYKEEGYIIEAQIKIVSDSKIEYITKEYFDEIYNEFESINFKALMKEEENIMVCDGGVLGIKMGMLKYDNTGLLSKPLRYTGKTKNFSTRVGLGYDSCEYRKERLKLSKLIDAIEAKVEFYKWFEYNYKEWKKCINNLYQFRIEIQRDIDRNW